MSYEDIAQQIMAEQRAINLKPDEIMIEITVNCQGQRISSVRRFNNNEMAYDQIMFGHAVSSMGYDMWRVLIKALPKRIPTHRPSEVRTPKAAKPRRKG